MIEFLLDATVFATTSMILEASRAVEDVVFITRPTVIPSATVLSVNCRFRRRVTTVVHFSRKVTTAVQFPFPFFTISIIKSKFIIR